MRTGAGRWRWWRAARAGAAAFAFFVVVAWAFHADMVRSLATRLDHTGDPLFCAWVLDWGHRCMAGLQTGLWNPPIFHPRELALAASDNLLWPGVLTLPLWLANPNPVLNHNVAYLLGVVLSGWCAWWWARRITGDAWSALLPGVAFSVGPFMLSHGGHLQVHHGYWIPLALLAIHVHAAGVRDASPRRWWSLGLGALCLPAQLASNTYFFAILLPAAGIAHVVEWWGLPRSSRPRAAAEVAAFWILAAALTAPLARPYFQLGGCWPTGRHVDEVVGYSASAVNYLGYNRENVWFGRRTAAWAPSEKALTPGLVVAALLLVPALKWERRRRTRHKVRAARIVPATALALAAFGFLMSLGPAPRSFGRGRMPGLYALFQAAVPGYGGMRVPARFAVLVVLGLSLLAAWNWRAVAARRRSVWTRRMVGALPAVFALAEFASIPRHPTFAPRPYASGAWLAEAPPGVVMERFWPPSEDTWKEDISIVYDSMTHRRPLVNGYSGVFPSDYRAIQHYTAGFPDETALRIARLIGADYFVLRLRRRAEWPPEIPLRLLAEFPGERIYAVDRASAPARAGEPRPAPAGLPLPSSCGWRVSAEPAAGDDLRHVVDGDIATEWRSRIAQREGSWIQVVWPESRPVAACRLRVAERSNSFPRHFRLLGLGEDGTWRRVEHAFDPVEFIESARAAPHDPTMTIRFPAGAPPLSGLRLELTQTCEFAPFALAEWEFFAADAARP